MALCYTALCAKNAVSGSSSSSSSPIIASSSSNQRASFAFRTIGQRKTHAAFRRMSCFASFSPHSAQGIRTSYNASANIFLKSPREVFVQKKLGKGGAMCSQCSLVLSNDVLRWVLTASALSLVLSRDARIHKPLLVPLIGLQLPQDVVFWCRGEYGLWAAFLALLVRLFYYIPGELELPLSLLLLLITAPLQVTQIRSTQTGIVLSIIVSAYVGFQYFSKVGQDVFNHYTFITTVGIVLALAIPIVLFFRGY